MRKYLRYVGSYVLLMHFIMQGTRCVVWQFWLEIGGTYRQYVQGSRGLIFSLFYSENLNWFSDTVQIICDAQIRL
jgi:hypothetical protein